MRNRIAQWKQISIVTIAGEATELSGRGNERMGRCPFPRRRSGRMDRIGWIHSRSDRSRDCQDRSGEPIAFRYRSAKSVERLYEAILLKHDDGLVQRIQPLVLPDMPGSMSVEIAHRHECQGGSGRMLRQCHQDGSRKNRRTDEPHS